MLDAWLKDTRTAGESERKKEEGGGEGRKRKKMQKENQRQKIQKSKKKKHVQSKCKFLSAMAPSGIGSANKQILDCFPSDEGVVK